MSTACVVLAAGLGTRMNSSVPKVLHRICGKTMVENVVSAARGLNPERVVVVTGAFMEKIRDAVGTDRVSFVRQDQPKGTGHALLCARAVLRDSTTIVVLNGDSPLISHSTIKTFLKMHRKDKNVISVLSFRACDPGAYGRIVRNGSGRLLSIVEDEDAEPGQKLIDEVNSGVYAMEREGLLLLDGLRKNREKGEYYLTDIVAAAIRRGLRAAAYCIGSEEEFMGVNTRAELYAASLVMRKRIVRKWWERGVEFIDGGSVYIDADVSIGKGTTIYPNVCLEGITRIGRDCVIYPNVRIRDGIIGKRVAVKDSSVIESSMVGDGASVGPFAHIRPGSEVGSEGRIGNFVELKKAVVGRGSKASHLSYLGDVKIGKDVNVGAGTITCNYDGEKKHATLIGDGVFVGSDSQLVAPVKVGRGAFIGAGSTITRNVPAGALAISRAEQKNIRDWVKKRRKKSGGKV